MDINDDTIQAIVNQFQVEFDPLESGEAFSVLTDHCTGARYCECHIRADKLVGLATIDAPLDPEGQPDFKANREILGNAAGFEQMKQDALSRRSFSNIVAEYMPGFQPERPLKILGGQHRYEAIRIALEKGVNELHGIKAYFNLDNAQRLDVAVISNRNLAISGALLDRLKETFRGPALRDWCHKTELLPKGHDFGSTTRSRNRITINLVRSFIHNFYLGKNVDLTKFRETDTTPVLYASGRDDTEWEELLVNTPDIWNDEALLNAGKEFAKLVKAQRAAFEKTKGHSDFSDKAMNGAVLSAWAFSAGMLQKNQIRLKKHYAMPTTTGTKDPLNADALSKGKHKSDKDSYRGLGYRTDARERAQMVELFSLLAESGEKVTPKNVNIAILAYFTKRAQLDEQRARNV